MTPTTPTRNLWPVGIIAALAIFITATVGLIVLACTHRSDLVSRDYYEQELQYQRQLDRLNRARRLPAPASVAYDAARHCLRISLPPDHVRRAAHGRIHLYRPSAAGLDRQMALAPDARGVQTVEARGLRPGLWKVRLTWTVEGQEYSLDEPVVIGPGAPAGSPPPSEHPVPAGPA